MKNTKGIFTISLDFELYWGIRDKKTIEQYGDNILGVWHVVPKLLELFSQYQIHVTWATVGAMMSKNKEEFLQFLPEKKPNYQDKNLSPYFDFTENLDKIDEKLIYGNTLVELVQNTKNQEIGTHTFSHFYALEPHQNQDEFFADLEAAKNIAKAKNIELKSFVFPRHQLNQNYINHFPEFGIETYRGTEKAWYHSASRGEEEGILKRAVRFADYYFPMFSHHCQDFSEIKQGNLYQIRASRWFRPFSEKWKSLDFLKIWRIKSQMKYAAKKGKIFHLWFHPHDIGINQQENFRQLEEIFKYYQILQKKYGMTSKNMIEIKHFLENGAED